MFHQYDSISDVLFLNVVHFLGSISQWHSFIHVPFVSNIPSTHYVSQCQHIIQAPFVNVFFSISLYCPIILVQLDTAVDFPEHDPAKQWHI